MDPLNEEQQAHVDKLIGDARVKAREKAQADAVALAAKDKEQAEQAALVAKNEWQKLAEQHKARATELEPLEKRVEVYEEMVKGMLKDAIERLGDAAKTAVTGLPKSMTAIDKLNWLNKNAGLFQAQSSDRVGTPARATVKRDTTGKAEPVKIGNTPVRF